MAMARLGLDKLIEARRCRSRDLVMAMVSARNIAPEAGKLGMTRIHASAVQEVTGSVHNEITL